MPVEVLVTGHPNTGTSFLAELVVKLGYHPGSDLKGADAHNQHGYWEHVGLQTALRGAVGFDNRTFQTGCWPAWPLELDEPTLGGIERLAGADYVSVFKDACLPLARNLFPDARVVAITRDSRAVYQSGQRAGDGMTWGAFKCGWGRYVKLLGLYLVERGGLLLRYERFAADFQAEAGKLALFLDRELPGDAGDVWRPRT